MFKAISDFLLTGFTLIISYVLYFIIAVFMTVLIGLPIGFGVKFIVDTVSSFFIGAR